MNVKSVLERVDPSGQRAAILVLSSNVLKTYVSSHI